MKDFTDNIKDYFQKEIEIIKRVDIKELNKAMNAINDALDRKATIYTMGNGGSAATASHMVCDFNKGISSEIGKRFHMICLNDNVPTLMAIANDLSYDDIFSFQLQGALKKDDLVIAISGSGNSKNIIKAVNYAKKQGAIVIGLTGYSGGKLKEVADYSMHVPIDDMQIAEDLHMIFDHVMMRVFCKTLR